MKSKSYIISFFLLAFFFSACNRRSSNVNQLEQDTTALIYPITIDVAEGMENISYENIMSDFVEEIEYVPLEFNKKCPINNYALPVITGQYIIIFSSRIYLFTRDGKFVREIGHPGNGSGEYGWHLLNIYDVDEKNQIIYVRKYGGNIILKYDFNGDHLGDIHVSSEEMGSLALIDSSALFFQYGLVWPYFGSYKLGWAVSLPKGDTLYIRKSYITEKTTKVPLKEAAKRPMYMWPHPSYKYQDQAMIFELGNDTIFTISREGLTPRYVFNFGKFRCSLELACSGIYDKAAVNIKPYILPQSFYETDRYFLMTFIYDERACTGIYDKKQNQFRVKASAIDREDAFCYSVDRLINDIDGGVNGAIYYPGASVIHVDRMMDILTSEHKNKNKFGIKNPQKHESLIDLVENLNENDNPVVVIYHLKK